jgi:YVTN family beta-propeller protein
MRHRRRRAQHAHRTWLGLVGVVVVLVVSCIAGAAAWAEIREPEDERVSADVRIAASPPASATSSPAGTRSPPVAPRPKHARTDLYRHTRAGDMSPRVQGIPERVYVPDNTTDTVSVINPRTFKVVAVFPVGALPQHVTPSWDLRHLYVDNSGQDSLTVIDPKTGRPTRTIEGIPQPYNLYFTPDGTKAIDVVEYQNLLDFMDPHTWKTLGLVHIPWQGVDHGDFTANGRYLLMSTEYSGVVVKIDTDSMRLVGSVRVGGKPIDVKASPSGKVFYVANQGLSGVSLIDPERMRVVGFLHTGSGAHGLAISRNGKLLYVANRYEGTISVISFAQRRVVATWDVGGSPDMLQVSPDGSQLWTSNRFDGTVSVIGTRHGHVITVIHTGIKPHGLAYFPQPGRYSLGHNGVYR